MAHDPKQIEQLARAYTEAWCSRDPARVAGHYVPGGTIAINRGDPAATGARFDDFVPLVVRRHARDELAAASRSPGA